MRPGRYGSVDNMTRRPKLVRSRTVRKRTLMIIRGSVGFRKVVYSFSKQVTLLNW